MPERDSHPAESPAPSVDASGGPDGSSAALPAGEFSAPVGASTEPGRSERGRAGGLWLIAVALAASVAADAAGAGGDPDARGWARPGAFAGLGAVAAAGTLLIAMLLGRLREGRRG